MIEKIRGGVCLAAAMMMLCALPACCGKGEKPMTLDLGDKRGGPELDGDGEGLPDIDIGGDPFLPAPEFATVYFDFDSAQLKSEAVATIEHNADIMKNFPGLAFQVAGHCDERGTQEYNMALGEQRALAVRRHLVALGVSGDRLITISYGEECPFDMGTGESAWSKNRRCEFNKADLQ